MNITLSIIGLGALVILINFVYIAHQKEAKTPPLYTAKSGDYKGQTHDIKDWRKIAIELARTTKNSRINAIAKHGTDEDIIGLLYLNFGIELFDESDI